MPDTAFGIDFGTTNTRVAYFGEGKPIVVPVWDSHGRRAYSIPSAVGYVNDDPVVFGHDVFTRDDVVRVTSIKWKLDQESPIDLGNDYWVEPLQVAEAFFSYIKEVVKNSPLYNRELSSAAITIPVNFPYRSRENLCKACKNAGIEVTHIFQEPVAGLYCHAVRNAHSSTAAVFDWGGGTLDIATVRVEDGRVQVKMQDGLKVGGDNFDRTIAQQALRLFASQYPDIRRSADELLEHPIIGSKILKLAEIAKVGLSSSKKEDLVMRNLLPNRHMEFDIRKEDFESWIELDVERAISCLKRTIRKTGVPETLVNPIILSGGTCNIPLVQQRMQQEFGPGHIVTDLPFLGQGDERAPEQDVSNATAIGAALLAVFGAEPVFASDVGIRTADTTGIEDPFYPVFKKDTVLELNTKKHERFFVTNTETGVARLLICDRLDQDLQPQGRLLRIVPIPIDHTERWVDVYFELTQHLGLKVYGSGPIAPCKREETECLIQDLNLGFRIPERSEVSFDV